MGTQSETVLKSFQTEFIDKNQNIIIPLMQRDYVQGGRLDVIDPFLNKLIDAIGKKQTQINLEYIYGYNTENGFVPIDGQQRLITLWLLHLYIYAKNNKPLSVELKFESREFADNFCTQLRDNLCGILKPDDSSEEKNTTKEVDFSLERKIMNCKWFISGWLLDSTVRNMLNTLQLIDDKMNSILDELHTVNITFDYLDMKDKDLDDDVYVKMNGRGRPLTYFENLKSLMDECIESTFVKDDKFTKDWKTKIDNEWTDLFWQNRNKGEEHPEEIDDEQIRFFYSMLLLYWKKNESKFLNSLDKEEPEEREKIKKATTRSTYISFLNEWEKEGGKLSEESTIEDIRKKTFSLLLNGKKMLPLYWIEETEVFNKEVFKFIKNGLESLEIVGKYVNELPKEIVSILDFESDFKKQTFLYQIAFKEASYAKTLPLLYSLIKTPERYKNESLYKWIRLWRNLVLNSNITAENIKNVCETIDMVSNKVDTDNLYQVVSELQWEKGFAFSEEQFKEEIAKAMQIEKGGKDWESIIIEAEKHEYLKGKIAALFNVDDKNDICLYDKDKIENFRSRYKLFLELANTEKKSPFYFVKVLLSHCDKEKPWTNMDLSKIKACLNDDILINCFRNITENKINESISKDWLKDLCTSELISKVGHYLKKGERSLFKNEGRRWNTFGNEIHNVKLGNKRNRILSGCFGGEIKSFSKESCRIYTDQKIDNCDFFWGEHIHFEYNNHFFQWWGNPNDDELDVYLMEEQWKDYKKRPSFKEGRPDKDNYYCFRVTDEMEKETSRFTEELERIIN